MENIESKTICTNAKRFGKSGSDEWKNLCNKIANSKRPKRLMLAMWHNKERRAWCADIWPTIQSEYLISFSSSM